MRARSEFPCILRGSAPPRRSVDTCAADANVTDIFRSTVVFVGEALHSDIAVE